MKSKLLEVGEDGWVPNHEDRWHRELAWRDDVQAVTLAVWPENGGYLWEVHDKRADFNPIEPGGPLPSLDEAKRAAEREGAECVADLEHAQAKVDEAAGRPARTAAAEKRAALREERLKLEKSRKGGA